MWIHPKCFCLEALPNCWHKGKPDKAWLDENYESSMPIIHKDIKQNILKHHKGRKYFMINGIGHLDNIQVELETNKSL